MEIKIKQIVSESDDYLDIAITDNQTHVSSMVLTTKYLPALTESLLEKSKEIFPNQSSDFALDLNKSSDFALVELQKIKKTHDEEIAFIARRFFYIGLQAGEISTQEKREIDLKKVFDILKDRESLKGILKPDAELIFFMSILKE